MLLVDYGSRQAIGHVVRSTQWRKEGHRCYQFNPRGCALKHTTVRYQSTKFALLCRLNYWSHGIEIFSDLWSSLIVFGNISEKRIALTKVLSLELKFSKPKVCEKDGNFRLQNGLTLLSRIWTSRLKSKKAHKMILIWCFKRFSKSEVLFWKTNFLGLQKTLVFQEISTFSVFLFSLVDHIIHICFKTWLNCVYVTFSPTKCI